MSTSPGAIIDDHLVRLVDERIHDALARTLYARPKEYSSVARPPGMSRRALVELCRRLARAGERGVRHVGNLWVADFDVFERHAARYVTDADAASPERWTPETALDSIGAARRTA